MTEPADAHPAPGAATPRRRRDLARPIALVAAVSCALLLGYVAVSPSGSTDNAAQAVESVNAVPTGPVPAALRTYYTQKVSWKPCGDGFRCAKVRVPVSYAKPAAYGDIAIAVTRRPADDQKRRLGSLLVNPGGPGGSGVEYAKAADLVVSAAVLKRYDLVGFDPRGVAGSAPVKCLSDSQLDTMLASDATPDSPAEVSTFRELSQILGAGCAKNAPRLAPRVDTVSAARDMDIIRAVVGDSRMTYLGKSYGTYLGATYARLFPGRVGRFVLDGVVDPKLDNVGLSKSQAMGFERAIRRFLANCVKRNDCPLDGGVEQAYSQLLKIMDSADATPLPTGDPRRPLTQALLQMGVIYGMYDATYGWPAERNALRGVVSGDGSDMLSLTDFFLSREDGHYKDNANEVIAAVNCIDRPDRPGVAQASAYASAWRKTYPMFGEILAWGLLACTDWPLPAVGSVGPWKSAGGVRIPAALVLGTTYDPATPVEGSRSLHKQLPGSRLLEWRGDGHTAYRQGSSCVDTVVDAYLLKGSLPKQNVTCKS